MAFNPNRDKLKQALGGELRPVQEEVKQHRKAGRPTGKTKKQYQFTLKPKNREKLDRMAQAAGYTGASTFLDEWIENHD